MPKNKREDRLEKNDRPSKRHKQDNGDVIERLIKLNDEMEKSDNEVQAERINEDIYHLIKRNRKLVARALEHCPEFIRYTYLRASEDGKNQRNIANEYAGR